MIEQSHRGWLPGLLERDHLAGQVLRFSLVGVLNTAVDFGLLNLLYHAAGFPLLLANTLSYSAGITTSFFCNKYWTFRAGSSSRWRREATLFLMVSLSALVVNDIGISLLHLIAPSSSVLALNAQKLGAAVLSMTWNFLGYRFLAFARSSQRNTA